MKILGTMLAALVTGCTTPQIPPCTVSNAWGLARAATPQSAARLSASIEEVAPRVAAAVPGLEKESLDVRLLPKVGAYRPFGLGGVCIETPTASWIEVGATDDPRMQDAVLAHELVHRWLGPDWKPLPPALEDGVANLVEESLAPDLFVRARMMYVVSMSTILTGNFAIDSYGAAVGRRHVPFSLLLGICPPRGGVPRVREILAADTSVYESETDQLRFFGMVSFGYLLASRIGIERLHDLCLRAQWEGWSQIPPDWIIDAAGLAGADNAAWNDAVLELYGYQEQRELTLNPPWLPNVEQRMRMSFSAHMVPVR